MITLAEAEGWLAARTAPLQAETVPLHDAAGRVLAGDVELAIQPAAPLATIEGLAVRAADTEGAGEYAPLPVGGMKVHSGDLLPTGADAVLPPHALDGSAALAAVARGFGTAAAGHDIPLGSVLAAGTLLTPLHLACLRADPAVIRRPRVAGARTPLLLALLDAAGAVAADADPDLVLDPATAATWHAEAIGIRPGEFTALGLTSGVPAVRLPPHPADAATAFLLLAAPALRRMSGRPAPRPVAAVLTRKISSVLGLVDAVRVRWNGAEATPLGPAEGLGLLAAAAANGLVLVPEGSEGYPAGATVPIWPL